MRTRSGICRRQFPDWPVLMLVLMILVRSCLVTGELAGVVPAGRRFHARFVVDRVRSDPRPSLPSSDGAVSPSLNPNSDDGEGPPTIVTTNTPAGASRCRQGCLQKRSIKDILCTQQRDCSMCWDVCNRNNQVRRERNELAHRLLLSLGRMIRNESVVTADIEWTTPAELVRHQPPAPPPPPGAPSTPTPSVSSGSDDVERLSRIARDGSVTPPLATTTEQEQQQQQQYHQCLVSWEISGGGLTGNLLTETFMVELSLWPNTKYYVHVTCRNKVTDSLIRSASLLVDTSEAEIVSLHGTSSSSTKTTTTTTTTTTAPSEPWASWASRRKPTRIRWALGEDEDEVQAVAAPSTGTSKEILILGAFVALLVLLLLSLTIVLVVRRKPSGAPDDREELLIAESHRQHRPTNLPPKIILHV